MVDKNLFVYDLAVVAILKNEAPYVKEWLDYHLLAGADHFFLYDNESPDNLKEVLQPYIDAGIVTYIFYPGQARQYEAYNDALRYKFLCRYMTWIDGDEFIFPKSQQTIAEVCDEVFKEDFQAALGVNWRLFGSNHHKKADLSRGVLDRFTARDTEVNKHVKIIANPRKIKFFSNPHYAVYLDNCTAVNENQKAFSGPFNEDKTAEKIVINHYHTKSFEEYEQKINRGNADNKNPRSIETFKLHDINDEFDDGILKYRDSRLVALLPHGDMENLMQSKKINFNRLFNSLAKSMLPTVAKNLPVQFFENKMETFLTCLSLSSYLKEKFMDENAAKFFEEAALNAICKTLHTGVRIYDMLMLIADIPRILTLPYSTVSTVNGLCLKILPQIMANFRRKNRWQDFHEMEYVFKMLKSFAVHKNNATT